MTIDEQLAYLRKGTTEIIREEDLRAKLEKSARTGKSVIGGKNFDWKPRDVFVVPSWQSVSHMPDGDAVLFSCSDRAAQEKLGLFREDRGNGPAGFGRMA